MSHQEHFFLEYIAAVFASKSAVMWYVPLRYFDVGFFFLNCVSEVLGNQWHSEFINIACNIISTSFIFIAVALNNYPNSVLSSDQFSSFSFAVTFCMIYFMSP